MQLSTGRIGSAGAAALAEQLSAGHAPLASISLTANRIGDAGAIALALSLASATRDKRRTQPAKLLIGWNGLTDAVVPAMVEAVKVGALKELYIDRNQLSTEGQAKIKAACSNKKVDVMI